MSTKLLDAVATMNQAVTIAFGLFLIIGGYMGFQKTQSLPSLAGGVVTGLIIIVSILRKLRLAVLLTTAFVCGFFALRYFRTGKMFPAGLGAGAGFSVGLLNLAVYSGSREKKDK